MQFAKSGDCSCCWPRGWWLSTSYWWLNSFRSNACFYWLLGSWSRCFILLFSNFRKLFQLSSWVIFLAASSTFLTTVCLDIYLRQLASFDWIFPWKCLIDCFSAVLFLFLELHEGFFHELKLQSLHLQIFLPFYCLFFFIFGFSCFSTLRAHIAARCWW